MKIHSCILFLLISMQSVHSRPNVIVIYTDDQGSIDLNSYGADDLETPNMDDIVKSGTSFTQFYAAPVCTPSRVSLLTGKSPQKAGVSGNISAVPSQSKGLSPSQYTMVDLFESAGYSTAHIGKWHLGYIKSKQPLAHGFDYSFGHLVGCIDNYSHFYYWKGPNRHDLYENGVEVHHEGEFFPKLMLTKTKAFIEANKSSPFFVYFAMNAPHYPYQGYEKWLRYYKKRGLPYPRNLYAAFLSTQDEIIGELMRFLDSENLTNNTIIVFQSDNGHSTEERAHYGGGSSGIYRGAKACLFEGGYRVPAAISWPGNIASGETRDQLAVNTDWLPTLADYCGIPFAKERIEGRSLRDIIEDPAAKTPHENGYCWQFREHWVVRKGNWKLHGNPVDTTDRNDQPILPKRFLVNLKEDPSETNNLAEMYPAKVIELEALYTNWKSDI